MKYFARLPFKAKSIFTLLFILITLIHPHTNALSAEPAVTLKQINPAFVMTAETLQRTHKQNKSVTLLDVRPEQDFNLLHIPGSMNIPLHFIKTKTFLKDSPIVIIEKGVQYARIEQECETLKKAGFKVSILQGGLNYWVLSGGVVQGDLWAKQSLNMVTSVEYYQEKNYDHWLIIDVGEKATAKDIMPEAVHLKLPKDRNKATSLFAQEAGKKNSRSTYVLIVNEQGSKYGNIKNIIKQTKLKNVFYLAGGVSAYRQYMNNHALTLASKQERTRTIRKCPTCGTGVENND